ncbi:DUF4843 domain-containing protein [Pedobacter punctiformis]|uniref:DUF4843 domain-containing protein n=1 Tax=Pedobacter punctiformis TaxID=3004097 RepID=A0ABT4L671_9SPHI|nr:DUF4843 domain-containing protein [Pedobacter sp. HCMS5-2]MCZ4243182.1 DUF4843 domain-containing protein [Pedobacter sp. HCMS5-2]
MKKNLYRISALLILVSILSCEKSLEPYHGLPDIYFNETARLQKSQGEILTDSVAISFSLSKAQDSIQPIIIAATGAPVNEDREYKMVIDPASTAIAGKHYVALPQSFTIKKNKVRDTIPLKLIRTADIQTTGVTLFFNLEPNQNFVTEMKDKIIDKLSGKKMSFIKYRLYINDILKKPGRWLDTYLGTFSKKKLMLMAQVINLDPIYLDKSVAVGEVAAYGKYMQRYLNEQKNAGNTIYEEDGTEMAMGPSSQ